MSHVREGEIHAYLDGALDRLGEARATEIRRHVDGCEDCRARLEEERRVRDVSVQLLDSSAPGSFDMPPFEEILRRAEAGPTGSSSETGGRLGATRDADRAARRSLGRTQRWAWAASLVLALGTGWLLRGSEFAQAGRSRVDSATIAMEAQRSPAGPEEADRFADASSVEDASRVEDALRGAGVPSGADGGSAIDQVADSRGMASVAPRLTLSAELEEEVQGSEEVQGTTVGLDEADQPRTVQPGSAESVAVGRLSQAAGARRARDQVALETSADSLAARSTDSLAQVGAARLAEERVFSDVAATERLERETVAAVPPPSEEENAPARQNKEGASDSVVASLAPGLPVIDISGDSLSVRVVQLLPEGDPLVLEFAGVEGAFALLDRPTSSFAENEAVAMPAVRTPGALLRRADADTPDANDELLVSEVRIARGAGQLTVRSFRPQAELEALLRGWGMLNP